MDEHGPETESSGALTPPPPHSPTAVAGSASFPPRGPSASRFPARRRGFQALIESALDGLDAIADRIAGAAGLR
jgi:hypothetical protein